ncbi:MAG TPA: 30S ribosomal protein S20 [Chthoniobacterales bacterium]|nr:30S ribosomal protein S20 [Chthoniobacterales bacterium]
MANTKSAAKRARQSATRALRNRSVRSQLRTLQRRVRAAAEPAADEIPNLFSAIDKAAKRSIIHHNAANRRKARLNKLLTGTAKK